MYLIKFNKLYKKTLKIIVDIWNNIIILVDSYGLTDSTLLLILFSIMYSIYFYVVAYDGGLYLIYVSQLFTPHIVFPKRLPQGSIV